MQYTKEVMEHFTNPRNMGEIENPDGTGQVGNLRCGDVMEVYVKIGHRPILTGSQFTVDGQRSAGKSHFAKATRDSAEAEEFIEDIKFRTLGCAAAIASSSMMTELAKGKSLEEAKKISRDDINEALGILPKQKYHCSILSAEAIHKAIDNYEEKNPKHEIRNPKQI